MTSSLRLTVASAARCEVRGAIFSTVDRSTGICGVCIGMFYEHLSLMAAADAEAREGKLLH